MSASNFVKLHIRWMIRRDMPEVLEIESKSFGRLWHDCQCFHPPWNEDQFILALRERNCIGMVAEGPDESIVGFMIYSLHKDRLELMSIAVHPHARREGVAGQLIDKLIGKLSHQRRRFIYTEVHECNLGALKFFRSQGFLATDLKKSVDESSRDSIVMEYYCDE